MDREASGPAMLAGLLDVSHLMPLDALPQKAGEFAQLGFTDLLIYVADIQRRKLRLLADPNATRRAGLSVWLAHLLVPAGGGRNRLVASHRGRHRTHRNAARALRVRR